MGIAWAWQARIKCMSVLMNKFIVTAQYSKQIIVLCSKFAQLEILVKTAHCS